VGTQRKSTIVRDLALVVLASCTALPANAVVVATNLGPGNTFSNNSILIENFLIRGEVTGFAASFVANVTATLRDVDLPLSSDVGGSLTVGIASDAGGQPGTVITLLTQNGSIPGTPRLVAFTCSNCPQLQANTTYWIAAVTTNLNTESFWYFSPNALGNASFSNAFANVGAVIGPWFTAGSTFPTPAFLVDGDIPVPPSGVPAPPSIVLALLGVGCTALYLVWRARVSRVHQA
jgi:hypothetical protein